MENLQTIDYAIKELSELNKELINKQKELKKKEKILVDTTDQWKEYIDNYIKDETIKINDQVKIVLIKIYS